MSNGVSKKCAQGGNRGGMSRGVVGNIGLS